MNPTRGSAAEVAAEGGAEGRISGRFRGANGRPGVIVDAPGQPRVVLAFAVSKGRIAAIDLMGDAAKLESVNRVVPVSSDPIGPATLGDPVRREGAPDRGGT